MIPTLPDLEKPIKEVLNRLAEYHDRAYRQTADTPTKRKNTRRIVCGFHEVTKNLKLNKLKFLIIANDLEKGAYEIGRLTWYYGYWLVRALLGAFVEHER